MLRKGITESFGSAIHALNSTQLTDGVINRSKRMMLDTLGVGLIGTRTAVFNTALKYSQLFKSEEKSSIWGKSDISLPAHYAAFVNGIAVSSMVLFSRQPIPEQTLISTNGLVIGSLNGL